MQQVNEKLLCETKEEFKNGSLTRLSGVFSGGTRRRGLLDAVDRDGLVHNEEFADDLPFTGPQQNNAVQDKAKQQQELTFRLLVTHF